MERNPYRREKLKRKFFGRTKEERRQKLKELREGIAQLKVEVAKREVEDEIHQREVVDKARSARRRVYAQRRVELGFNDKGAEEVDDDVLEVIENRASANETQLQEARDRKPINLAANVEFLSRKDQILNAVENNKGGE